MSLKDDLLRELDEGYAAFKATIEGLDDARLQRVFLGDWSAREVLAHVAGWHREMSGALERLGRGERPTAEGVSYADDTAWNAQFVEKARSLSPAEMRAELDASFVAFRGAAAAVPEERYEAGRTVDRMLHTTGINHYREHGGQIEAWRRSL